jgi:HEAT repeat protein
MSDDQIEQARQGLASENPGAVIFSLKTLGTFGKLTDLQSLMSFINSATPRIRQAAVEATCTMIKENLILHFHELDKSMRDRLGALMQTIDPTVLDEISKDLYSDNEDRRLRAVQILGHMRKNPKIREVLANLVQDRDVKVRATAVNLMGKVIEANDHDVLLALLNDSDKRVRANTLEALESLGNRRMVPILLRFRYDPNNRIRGNVLKALYRLGYSEIEQDLLEMIKSPNNFMRASALWVISQVKISSVKIVDACGFCLLSDDEMVSRNARKAIETVDGPRAKGYLRYLGDVGRTGASGPPVTAGTASAAKAVPSPPPVAPAEKQPAQGGQVQKS